MRLLFLTSRVPYPPHRGDKLRTFNFLRSLSRDHDIALVSFTEHAENSAARTALSAYCREVVFVPLPRWRSWGHVALFVTRSAPSQVAYYQSRKMRQTLETTAARFRPDAAYIHLFRLIPYRTALPRDVYTILDLTDVISKELFRSLPYRPRRLTRLVRYEAERVRQYERWATKQAHETWVISDDERHDLLAAGGEGEIHVVPNGLPRETMPLPRAPEPALVLFYGYAPVYHNQDALRFLIDDILPRVRPHVPALRLKIVGAGRDVPRRHRGIPMTAIDFLGFMEDPAPLFARATVLVAPLRFSAGVQNKIIEALAAQVPVITSPFGNEGIRGRDGVHLAVCETAEDFVSRIIALIKNPEEREAMAKRGQAYARSHFSWENVRDRLRSIAEAHTGREDQGIPPN